MRKKEGSKNLNLIILFFAVLLFIVISSFILKGIVLFKNAKFDGKNNYNIAIVSNKNASIISFSPQNSLINIMLIKNFSGNFASFLKIPIDGYVYKQDMPNSNKLTRYIASFFSYEKNYINAVDIFRLILFSRSVRSHINVVQFDFSDWEGIKSNTAIMFIDPLITTEKKTIEIVNGSEIPGLGNRLATYLTNIGGNVILVTNSKDDQKSSKILYSGKLSYTVEKISESLNIKYFLQKNNSIADVIIVLGKDRAGKSDF